MTKDYDQGAGRRAAGRGEFFRCVDAQCGLRFPVAAGDPFDQRCPRCRGAVERVAVAGEVRGEHLPADDFSTGQLATPSRICLLLDNWRSLFNVGAAFRTADGAGLRHLYLCGITGTPANQTKLAKTALGAERTVAWSYHADAVRVAAGLQDAGWQLWVLERGSHATSLFSVGANDVTGPVVLAAGNEVVGVDPGLLDMADRVIQLPMLGHKESLNVAIAVSVAAYWLRAQESAHFAQSQL